MFMLSNPCCGPANVWNMKKVMFWDFIFHGEMQFCPINEVKYWIVQLWIRWTIKGFWSKHPFWEWKHMTIAMTYLNVSHYVHWNIKI